MRFDFLTFSLRHGLFHQEQDGISCFLPGSAITVRFHGREVTAEIEDVNGEGKSWVNVYIDDLPVRVMRIDPDNRVYQLADDLEDAPHTLTLQKRTEAAFGTLKFTNLTTENGIFLSPPSPLPRRLLIIGDSITCGFGNEAQIPCDCDASRENIALAYSSLTGQFLNAETLIVGASGTGCYQNFGGSKKVACRIILWKPSALISTKSPWIRFTQNSSLLISEPTIGPPPSNPRITWHNIVNW